MNDEALALLRELVRIWDETVGMSNDPAFVRRYRTEIALVRSLVEATDAAGPGETHPDLIDGDGDRWAWTGVGYRCVNMFSSTYSRGYVEQYYGPVTEVPSEPEEAGDART